MNRRQWVGVLLIVAGVLVFSLGAFSQEATVKLDPARQTALSPMIPPPAATEVHVLRRDKISLRLQLLDARRKDLDREQIEIQAEAKALEADLRALLKPPADALLDWQTLTFKPSPAPPEKATPK